jgi:SAM-dependent methyltransferase
MPASPNQMCCLLCASERLDTVASLTGREIQALWRECGTELPPEALGGINQDSTVPLRQCEDCGFQFFDPALAGNSLFYQLLESADYYCPDRPEFRRTVRFAIRRKVQNVLDVGCGAGGFLDMARQAGLQTFGLELNPNAAEKARAKGHRIFDRLLHELPADARPEGFALITLFQVLEHLADPVGTLKEAATRLKPGGYISIAVPSRSGIYRLMPWDPTQWPPHHVSRWRLDDFQTLAKQSNLQLLGCGGDILLGSTIHHAIQLNRRMSAALGKRSSGKSAVLPGLLTWLYRKTGMKHITPHWGPSIYAYFQKL